VPVQVVEHVEDPQLWHHPSVERSYDLFLELGCVLEAELGDMVEIRGEFGVFLVVDIDGGGKFGHIVVIFSVQVLNRSPLVEDNIVCSVDARHGWYGWFGVTESLPRSRSSRKNPQESRTGQKRVEQEMAGQDRRR
jgi:hypothetical protein